LPVATQKKRNSKANYNLKVSLVSTVFNEERTIEPFIESLFAMKRVPDEVIIVDGGSTDETARKIKGKIDLGLPVRLIVAPGNRSLGRNVGVRAATHDVIAITDAGCRLDPVWLLKLVEPFEKSDKVDVAAGFYRYAGETPFQKAAGIVATKDVEEIDPENFLASTRSIGFRRRAFEKVDGFDERYWHNEDTPFNLALKQAGGLFEFAPEAMVIWLPPKRLRSHFYKYYRFGKGDGQARIFGKTYSRLYGQYIFYLTLFAAGMIGARPVFAVLAPPLVFGVFQFTKYRKRIPDAATAMRLPAAVLARDLGNMIGYASGRLRPRPKPGAAKS
jgi:glycosyltransferase involved in cell wall biosynthesis